MQRDQGCDEGERRGVKGRGGGRGGRGEVRGAGRAGRTPPQPGQGEGESNLAEYAADGPEVDGRRVLARAHPARLARGTTG